jgi:hypothetical protein
MARALVAILAALALVGCGGDDDDSAGSDPTTSATDATAEGAPYDISVGEFLVELQPDKQKILKAFVADSDACQAVEVDPSFVLLVSAQAIDADPEAPLADLVEEQC